MKALFRNTTAAAFTLIFSSVSTLIPSPAWSQVTFGQQEVDQSRYIAIAAPFGNNQYQLVIIEQLNNKRLCWSESGSNPTVVDPLFTTFDFTGICGRSTDSNGYSIRMAGTDLGTRYSFNLVRRDNNLVLVGQNFTNRNDPVLTIGNTNGVVPGQFLRVNLDPQWRFARRTFNGRVLGHVYLATNQAPPGGQPVDPQPTLSFRDIANDVYAQEIEAAVKMGFVSGFAEDNTFRPQESLTREQLVSMVLEGLVRLPNLNITLPTQSTGNPYPDVPASRWSAAKIQWARDNKIVSGYQDGTFKPTQPVTRAELLAVQRRAAEFAKTRRGLPAELTVKNPARTFSDTTGHWSATLVTQMSSYCNVASPVNETGTQFQPNSPARRNYAAAATLRMLNCVRNEQ